MAEVRSATLATSSNRHLIRPGGQLFASLARSSGQQNREVEGSFSFTRVVATAGRRNTDQKTMMIGNQSKCALRIFCIAAFLSLLLAVPVSGAILRGSVGVHYDNSSASTSTLDAPSFSSSSSSRSLFLNLDYGSYVWDRRFLEYLVGFSTTFDSSKVEQGSGGFRSRGYSFQGNFFRTRPLNFSIFGSKLSSRSFGDLVRLDPGSSVLVPISNNFNSTNKRYGFYGSWNTDFFQYFNFGYNRNILEQQSDSTRASQIYENASFHAEKDTERTRNRFDFLRQEQSLSVSDVGSGSWSAYLTNTFHLLDEGYLNAQNGYSSVFNTFSQDESNEPSSPGVSLPQSLTDSRSFYSNLSWNHSPSSRYRYVLGAGYNLSDSRVLRTSQWNLAGDVYWNLVQWFSVFGGAGASEIHFGYDDFEENSRLRTLRGGAIASASYKGVTGSLSGSVSKGRIHQVDDAESGDFRQASGVASLNATPFSGHSASAEFVAERTRNELTSVLNYDRIRFGVGFTAQNVKSWSYGTRFTKGFFYPVQDDFTILKSESTILTAFLSRPIIRRGRISFHFASRKQDILDEKTKGNAYRVALDLRITSHLYSYADLEIEDFMSEVLTIPVPTIEERLLKKINVNFRYVFGLSRIEVRFFLDENHFEFDPRGNPFDSSGRGIIISFTREFRLI